MKFSGLQSAIDGARFDVDQGSSLIRCDPCYFTTALLAPAARWRYARPYRQHAMCLHRDFRSSSAHGAGPSAYRQGR